MLTGWDFFRISNSLKLHFTTEKYDCVKYGGKTTTTYDSFQRRRDKLRYDSFAHKLIGDKKAGHLCIANFVYGSKNFLYEPYDDAYDVYLKWLKIKESITRVFEKDVGYLNRLVESKDNLNLFESTKSGNYPPLLQVLMGGHITVETACILNKEHKDFFDKFMLLCQNDPMVSEMMLKWKKYQTFVSYDPNKIKSILKEAIF